MSDTPEELSILEIQGALGAEAAKFVDSALGQTLMDDLDGLAKEALNELKSADAKDTELIQELQHKVWRAEYMMKWFIGVIQEGRNADEMMRQQVDESENTEE